MKKRRCMLTLLLSLCLCLFCGIFFVSCDNGGAGSVFLSEGILPAENKISFKTLAVDGTNASGVVANEITEFSFVDEIEKSGDAKYTVSLDEYGEDLVFSKVVPLNPGDNTFYVFETVDDDITATYNVTIRRRPIHSVYFYLNDSLVHMASAEEGTCIEQPDINIIGYTNIDWKFDFSQPLTKYSIVDISATLLPELSDYEVVSTQTTCEIVRVKNKDITKIVIPDCVTSIGYKAFSNSEDLVSVTLGKNVTKIGANAFQYCYNLSELNNTETIQWIDSCAFEHCYRLKNFALDSVVYIGDYAFKDCASLTEMYLPTTVDTVKTNAFYNCTALTVYCEASDEPQNWSSHWDYSYTGSIPVVWDCTNNDVATDDYIYIVLDGLRFGIFDGVAEVVNQSRNLTTAYIPSSITYKDETYTVTEIGYEAFENCGKLRSVVIPKTVTFIGSQAFSGCYALSDIRYLGTGSQFLSMSYKTHWAWESSVKATDVQCSDMSVLL